MKELCSVNNYKIPCILGKGGFGVVTLQKDGDKKYALKTLLDQKNHHNIKIMKKQYENLLLLKNKNICDKYICLFGEKSPEQEYNTIKMEYLNNYMELFDYVTNTNIVKTLMNTRIIAKKLLNAMNELHRNDIVHGDIKLENIMILYENGIVKDVRIIDFQGMIVKKTNTKFYKLDVYTNFFVDKKNKEYTFRELIEHDQFCMAIAISLLIGYNNNEFQDTYSKFVRYGKVGKLFYAKLNIFQQLNLILNYYLDLGVNLFKENDIGLFVFVKRNKKNKKQLGTQLSIVDVFKSKFLNIILNHYDDKIFKVRDYHPVHPSSEISFSFTRVKVDGTKIKFVKVH